MLLTTRDHVAGPRQCPTSSKHYDTLPGGPTQSPLSICVFSPAKTWAQIFNGGRVGGSVSMLTFRSTGHRTWVLLRGFQVLTRNERPNCEWPEVRNFEFTRKQSKCVPRRTSAIMIC